MIAFSNAAAGGGQGLFAPPAATATTTLSPDDLADLIKRSVSPLTWSEEGNAIAVQGSMLLVTASDDVQRLIREFLRAQSDQRNLAVRIDARWEDDDLQLRHLELHGDGIDLTAMIIELYKLAHTPMLIALPLFSCTGFNLSPTDLTSAFVTGMLHH